jgi:hypothetical protein
MFHESILFTSQKHCSVVVIVVVVVVVVIIIIIIIIDFSVK